MLHITIAYDPDRNIATISEYLCLSVGVRGTPRHPDARPFEVWEAAERIL